MALNRFIQVVLFLAVCSENIARPQQPVVTATTGLSSNHIPDLNAPQLNTLQKLIQMLETCGQEDQRTLKKVYLSSSNVTCNDGSPAGFYLRKTPGSKRWIVFLEGGWYCYDRNSCQNRWLRLRHLMSSKQWPDTRKVGGILSSNPDENPFWWNANHVYLPYCTSDSWSGSRTTPGDDVNFTFMGSLVVQQAVKDLLPMGLTNASSLLLAGSSAGGTGVIVNLDLITELLHDRLGLHHIEIRGASDSGWFLDRAPYSSDIHSVSPLETIQRGLDLWHGQVSPRCQLHYPNEQWRCYIGYRIYPTLSAPLFVFQWLFDEAQMTADNVGTPVTKQQWDYIHKTGDSLRQSFQNVSAVFAPSCISHTVFTKKDWLMVKIGEISLPHALRCWEVQPYENQLRLLPLNSLENSSAAMLADEPLVTSNRPHRNMARLSHYRTNNITIPNMFPPGSERRRRRRKKHNNGNRTRNRGERNKGRKKKGKKGNRKREQRSALSGSKNRTELSCQHRLIEKCSWPQCNHSCPKLTNPFTGEEMDFIELLKSFGLDMASVATALGIDIQTLNNMDHDELLNLLTQQAK